MLQDMAEIHISVVCKFDSEHRILGVKKKMQRL
jgi:hypothetical protein